MHAHWRPLLCARSERARCRCRCPRDEVQLDTSCVCPPGRDRAAEAALCTPCERGFYKPWASDELCTLCGDGASSHLTTAGKGSTAASQCVCSAGYYAPGPEGEGEARVACAVCPEGVLCSTDGATLATLQLEEGFWRLSPFTLDIRACVSRNLTVHPPAACPHATHARPSLSPRHAHQPAGCVWLPTGGCPQEASRVVWQVRRGGCVRVCIPCVRGCVPCVTRGCICCRGCRLRRRERHGSEGLLRRGVAWAAMQRVRGGVASL